MLFIFYSFDHNTLKSSRFKYITFLFEMFVSVTKKGVCEYITCFLYMKDFILFKDFNTIFNIDH